MTTGDVAKGAATALIGALLGWGGHSLTLVGRVDALESGQTAILMRLDALLLAKGLHPIKEPTP